jgi:Tfp pilus assembly protein PilN
MTQVNLLPTETKERQQSRRVTALAVFGVAGVVMLMLLVYLLQVGRLSSANRQLTAQNSINQDLQSKITGLQQFADLKANVTAKQALVTGVLHGEVLWSGVLHDLSMVIPDKMWLTNMTGTLTPSTNGGAAPATGAPVTGGAPALVGSIQFQGYSFDHPTVALWLTRLVQVHGWVNAWITNASRTVYNNTPVVQFSSSTDLTTDATTNGGPK